MSRDAFSLDRARVRRAFSQAAARYDALAALQREVGERLLERYDVVRREPGLILDLGCGTGAALAPLGERFPRAELVALDFAPGMLAATPAALPGRWFRRRRIRRICAEAERIPLPDASVDLVHSNLMLQWCEDPVQVFGELRRILRPGGLINFTSFGPDTLCELRAAWAEVDSDVHVNRFLDMHDLGDALLRAGLADPVMDQEPIRTRYPDLRSLMLELKGLGAHNANSGRPRGLTGRRRLAALERAYPKEVGGELAATWEVVYGHAWAGELRPPAGSVAEVVVPLDRLRRP